MSEFVIDDPFADLYRSSPDDVWPQLARTDEPVDDQGDVGFFDDAAVPASVVWCAVRDSNPEPAG